MSVQLRDCHWLKMIESPTNIFLSPSTSTENRPHQTLGARVAGLPLVIEVEVIRPAELGVDERDPLSYSRTPVRGLELEVAPLSYSLTPVISTLIAYRRSNRSEIPPLADRERSAIHVFDFKDDMKCIVTRGDEEKIVSGISRFKLDVKGSPETITPGDRTRHMFKTQILSAERKARPEEKIPKQHTKITSYQMKPILDGKSSELGIPYTKDETRCTLENIDWERDAENFSDIHEVQP